MWDGNAVVVVHSVGFYLESGNRWESVLVFRQRSCVATSEGY